jgi:hypothetical protein
MLNEKQDILGKGAGDPLSGDVPLELERLSVRHSPERYRP